MMVGIVAECEHCAGKWMVPADIKLAPDVLEGSCMDCQHEGDVERPLTFRYWGDDRDVKYDEPDEVLSRDWLLLDDSDEYKDDMPETHPDFYKGVAGKRSKDSPPIDFSEWNLFNEDEVTKFFKQLLQRGFQHATENYECYVTFSSDFAEDMSTVDDPTEMRVSLPIGETEDESPQWRFSLSDIITSLIEWKEAGIGGPIEGNDRPLMEAVRDDLRRFANKLDAALKRKPRPAAAKKKAKPELKE